MKSEQVPPFQLDEKSQDSIKMEKSKAGDSVNEDKLERFLDAVLPLMLIMSFTDAIAKKFHSKCKQPEGNKGLNPGSMIELNTYLSNSYEQVIKSCDEITEMYKNELLNMKYFEEFVDKIGLKS
mmetsp:Transcript_22514/g.19483  ORF Transcript_22514/g.19483 Transcript_22514/m.19483 type:complete len:124 (+) Transcript_22514:2062-2433(+)